MCYWFMAFTMQWYFALPLIGSQPPQKPTFSVAGDNPGANSHVRNIDAAD
jgi:hypothetical protein